MSNNFISFIRRGRIEQIQMGCKQRLACENNKRQNFVGRVPAWTQCRPEAGYEHSGKCLESVLKFNNFVSLPTMLHRGTLHKSSKLVVPTDPGTMGLRRLSTISKNSQPSNKCCSVHCRSENKVQLPVPNLIIISIIVIDQSHRRKLPHTYLVVSRIIAP